VWEGLTRESDSKVAWCFTTALLLEVAAHPKPGLVDRVTPLKEIDIFRLSASAAALYPYFASAARLGRLGRARGALGRLVLRGAEASLNSQRGGNAHLGAILLAIPLAAAAGRLGNRPVIAHDLRRIAWRILLDMDWRDATHVLEAIRFSSPGGLGRVPFLDVKDPRTYRLLRQRRAGLVEVFRCYLGRDMVADELAQGYPLVFEVCHPSLTRWERDVDRFEEACVNALLEVMSRRPDTHIARRRGIHVARITQKLASDVLSEGGVLTRRGLRYLRELDDYLRRIDARPGSSADILAAAIGVRLLEGLRL
jgi:triphosphoribosyl-dephospho-CoA synthase